MVLLWSSCDQVWNGASLSVLYAECLQSIRTVVVVASVVFFGIWVK